MSDPEDRPTDVPWTSEEPEDPNVGEERADGEFFPEATAGRDQPPSPPEPPYSTDFFEEADDERFSLPGVQKLGIVGGKQTGKSYLFQAMVYRTYAGPQSGALNYFLNNVRLFYALRREDKAQTFNLNKFIKKYIDWERLPQTLLLTQQWYRLRLQYRKGILGRDRSALDVEFFDGSGEAFFEAPRSAETRKIWQEGYRDARVMVFCLPLWAAFPAKRLTREDWRSRDRLLEGFAQVVQNYINMRERNSPAPPVKCILALTMADDQRSALTTLRDRWIAPYMESPQTYLKQLRRGSYIARYLANARQVSAALHEEFAESQDPRVLSVPQSLDFGSRPWLIPVSAMDGGQLELIESDFPLGTERPAFKAPVPVHVELPLLVALCDRANALM